MLRSHTIYTAGWYTFAVCHVPIADYPILTAKRVWTSLSETRTSLMPPMDEIYWIRFENEVSMLRKKPFWAHGQIGEHAGHLVSVCCIRKVE